MSKLISYTGEENLMRIKMQKRTKFILIEGEDDIPIYESIFNSSAFEKNINIDFEITFGGGKPKILDFIKRYQKKNFKAILDLDFDYNEKIVDSRTIYLDCYSLENYFFNKIVFSYLIANILKKNMNEVKEWLDISTWYNHVNSECILCLKYLFYYQKAYNGDRNKWSNTFIVSNNSIWKIDQIKINGLVAKIKEETNVGNITIEEYFISTFPKFKCVSRVFPGKMLFVSFYRFIKQFLEKEYAGKFGSNFSNDSALKNFAASFLRFNPNLRRLLDPVFIFLTNNN